MVDDATSRRKAEHLTVAARPESEVAATARWGELPQVTSVNAALKANIKDFIDRPTPAEWFHRVLEKTKSPRIRYEGRRLDRRGGYP